MNLDEWAARLALATTKPDPTPLQKAARDVVRQAQVRRVPVTMVTTPDGAKIKAPAQVADQIRNALEAKMDSAAREVAQQVRNRLL